MAKVKNPRLYRSLRHLRRGGLHRALHVAEGDKIPAEKLAAARTYKNAHVRKMAELAHTMSKWHKK